MSVTIGRNPLSRRVTRKQRNPEKHAWKKLFGGLRVGEYFLEVIKVLNPKPDRSWARGPRPDTFYKLRRVKQ